MRRSRLRWAVLFGLTLTILSSLVGIAAGAVVTVAAHDVMLSGAAALALTGADVVTDPAIRAAVRASFAAEPWHRRQWRGSGA